VFAPAVLRVFVVVEARVDFALAGLGGFAPKDLGADQSAVFALAEPVDSRVPAVLG
jgi:hypothetical protein